IPCNQPLTLGKFGQIALNPVHQIIHGVACLSPLFTPFFTYPARFHCKSNRCTGRWCSGLSSLYEICEENARAFASFLQDEFKIPSNMQFLPGSVHATFRVPAWGRA